MKYCRECNHTPSCRFDCHGWQCYCKCHDVADAAPALLEACRAAAHWIQDEKTVGPLLCLTKLNEAITLAEGKAKP